MRQAASRVLCSVLSVALITCDFARAQTVQVQLNEDLHVRRQGVLVQETVIPKGTIVQVAVEDFNAPMRMRSWGPTQGQDDFVKGIRIVSAPGFSAEDISRLNTLGGARGLFMRKSFIGEARVVKVLPSETNAAAAQQMEVTHATPIHREHQPDPAEAPSAINNELAIQVVNSVERGNTATRSTGRSDQHCLRCNNEFYNQWLRSGVSKAGLDNALDMYYRNPRGVIKNRRYITIVDFSKRSGEKRMFILDTSTGDVEKLYTTHGNGRGSVGQSKATKFGNRDGSFLTPPGFHVTGRSYHHSPLHGKTLRMNGIESRNSESAGRAILIHEAWYASDRFVRSNGYAGRTQGCLGIDPSKTPRIIRELKGGSLIYNYTGRN